MCKDGNFTHFIYPNEENLFDGANVEFFGGNLLMLPKKSLELDKIPEFLQKVCNKLNGEKFRKNYTYSGRFKIGHRQLFNAFINIQAP